MRKQSFSVRYLMEFYFTVGIPLLYLANVLTISNASSLSLTAPSRLTGILIAGIGLGLWIISYFNLGRSFGVMPKTQKKISIGVYRGLRHPMYLGIIYTFFGLSLANQSAAGLKYTLLLTAPILLIRGMVEERQLSG